MAYLRHGGEQFSVAEPALDSDAGSCDLTRMLRYNVGTSMISGRIGCELAVVAVFCVLTIFLFPSVQGPYSVVHGPVTALLAARAAIRWRITLAQSALGCLYCSLILPVFALSRILLEQAVPAPSTLPESVAILRC